MLREEGIVVGLEGTYALVANQRKSACGSCHAESSCGTLSGGLGKKVVVIRAHNPLQAEVGERVVLEISETHFLRTSFLVYVVPILSMVLVGSLVRFLALFWVGIDAESMGALAGLAALILSFYGLHRYNTHIQDDISRQPAISRIIPDVSTAVKSINGENVLDGTDVCSVH